MNRAERRKQKIGKDEVIYNPLEYRAGTKSLECDTIFWFKHGAMGDYICHLAAIKWIAETQFHVRGHLVVPNWFYPIAQNVMKPYHRFKLYKDDIPKELPGGTPIKVPTLNPVNATGAHMVDIGFIYYANLCPPPKGAHFYPGLDLTEYDLVEPLDETVYAVMTPGATSTVRTMPPEVYNGIAKHLTARGVTPVHLGTSNMAEINRKIGIDNQYDLNVGINLVDQTTLLEAARVLASAELVVGLDNGLLHLAAMTDVDIVFGYNVASPEHRRPYRKDGKVFELYLEPRELNCTFCQSRMRFLYDHDFLFCVYQDYKCLELMNVENYAALIDQSLGVDAKEDFLK